MLTLGLIARNEEEMLRRTLPVYAPWFKCKWLLDTGSTDGTEQVAVTHNFFVIHEAWSNDFSYTRNSLLELAKASADNAGWLLQLDADEAMFPCDLISLERLCATVKEDVIALPRVNLAARATLKCIDNAPDYQARCVRLGSSIRWELPVHEVINAPQHRCDLPIYHYGWCKPPRANWLRSHNYRMIAEGGEVLAEAPDTVSDDYDAWLADMQQRHKFVSFYEVHPLMGLI